MCKTNGIIVHLCFVPAGDKNYDFLQRSTKKCIHLHKFTHIRYNKDQLARSHGSISSPAPLLPCTQFDGSSCKE